MVSDSDVEIHKKRRKKVVNWCKKPKNCKMIIYSRYGIGCMNKYWRELNGKDND